MKCLNFIKFAKTKKNKTKINKKINATVCVKWKFTIYTILLIIHAFYYYVRYYVFAPVYKHFRNVIESFCFTDSASVQAYSRVMVCICTRATLISVDTLTCAARSEACFLCSFRDFFQGPLPENLNRKSPNGLIKYKCEIND